MEVTTVFVWGKRLLVSALPKMHLYSCAGVIFRNVISQCSKIQHLFHHF